MVGLLAPATFAQSSSASSESNPLIGAWRMVSYTLEFPDTTTSETDIDNPQTKIFTPTHFAFGYQTEDGQKVVAGGGSYELEDETYTEHVEYHTETSYVGEELTFTVNVEGDTLIQSGPIGEGHLREVYVRIEQ
jgi:hypothetical protein